MVVVPPARPLTSPVLTFTDAMVVLLLVQLPPVAASARVVALPWHTLAVPVMGNGVLTETMVVAMQPKAVV